jgi:SAM-dependent methyltransferase
MLHKLKAYLLREQFRPSFFGLFLNPFFFGRLSLYKYIKNFSKNITGVTLDIGCGSKPYAELFLSDKYIGMDIEVSGHSHIHNKVDVYYDGNTFPFENNYFTSVVCFEVLEHVFNPETFLKETNRVLKQGGVALFTVPFIWDEHEQPYDYARYSSFGLDHLFRNNGFTVLESKKYLHDMRLFALLTNVYIFKTIKKIIPSRASYLLILPLTTIVNLFGCLLYLFPKNHDFYFGNIFLIKK